MILLKKISYFLVPALAKYRFDNQLYLEGGPQFGLMYRAFVEYNYDIDGNSARVREDNKEAVNIYGGWSSGRNWLSVIRRSGMDYWIAVSLRVLPMFIKITPVLKIVRCF